MGLTFIINGPNMLVSPIKQQAAQGQRLLFFIVSMMLLVMAFHLADYPSKGGGTKGYE